MSKLLKGCDSGQERGTRHMEMEISVEDYLKVIAKWWKVIIAVFLGSVVAAAAVSFWQPPTYEASVTMLEPSYQVMSETRIMSLDEPQKLYNTLAKSANLEAQVIEVLEPTLSPSEQSPGALLSMVRVVPNKNNPALFEIRAKHTDPEVAVDIANTWASQYVDFLSRSTAASGTELGFIGQELAAAESELQSAEEQLRAFEEDTGLGIAPNQEYGLAIGSAVADPYLWYGARGKELEAKSQLLADHRVARDSLLLLLDIAHEARENGGDIADLPLQLLSVPAIVDRGRLSPELLLQEAKDLDTIIELLQAEERSLSAVIDVLSSEVSELHTELMQQKYEYLLLNQTRQRLLERIDVLSRKADELELVGSGLHIVSPAVRAVVVSTSPWLNVSAAGVAGLLVGILLAFGLEYLQRSHGSSAR